MIDEGGSTLAGLMNPLSGDSRPFAEELLDPQGVHRARGVLPGWNGIPFRGQVPDIKQDDPDSKQPQTGMHAHVDILILSDPKQLKKYEEIVQLMANGFAAVSAEERVYDPDIKSWRVFLRWVEYYSFVEKGN